MVENNNDKTHTQPKGTTRTTTLPSMLRALPGASCLHFALRRPTARALFSAPPPQSSPPSTSSVIFSGIDDIDGDDDDQYPHYLPDRSLPSTSLSTPRVKFITSQPTTSILVQSPLPLPLKAVPALLPSDIDLADILPAHHCQINLSNIFAPAADPPIKSSPPLTMPSPALTEATAAYTALKSAFVDAPSPDLDKCASLLTTAKLALAKAGALVVVDPSKAASLSAELTVAREILEIGALYSIHAHSIPDFERYFSQLLPYYTDLAAAIPTPSPRHRMLRGLHLLSLLAQSRIAEFHAALERIPADWVDGEDVYIAHAVRLEQALMEGAYNKVWTARTQVPCREATWFVELLMGTIRNEIASCAERSYTHLPMQDVATLLFFPAGASQLPEVRDFCAERGWSIAGGAVPVVQFGGLEAESAAIDAHAVIRDVIGYAREIERIV